MRTRQMAIGIVGYLALFVCQALTEMSNEKRDLEGTQIGGGIRKAVCPVVDVWL